MKRVKSAGVSLTLLSLGYFFIGVGCFHLPLNGKIFLGLICGTVAGILMWLAPLISLAFRRTQKPQTNQKGGNKMRCKNLMAIVCLAITLLATIGLNAQDNTLVFSKARVYSGQCALSSGLGGAVDFTAKDGSATFSLEFNQILGQVVYTRNVGHFSIGPSFGQQTNAPWVAPIVVYSPWKWVSLTTWDGIYFGKPGHPGWDTNFGFAYQAVDFSFGNFGFGYSLLHFLQEKSMSLPYAKYTWSFGNLGVDISGTYNVRNKEPMFLVSGFYKKI
jgi:hypothetical protein